MPQALIARRSSSPGLGQPGGSSVNALAIAQRSSGVWVARAVAGPIVSNVVVSNITATGAQVDWDVFPASGGRLEFGQTALYGNVTNPQLDSSPLTHHTQFITGMPSGATIHLRIWPSSNGAYGAVDRTFATLAGTTYDTVFSGDATGATDIRAALVAWINANGSGGRKLALSPNGIYKLHTGGTGLWSETTITPHDCSIDWRGARILTDMVGQPTFRCWNVHDVTFNDPWFVGNGYANAGPGSRSENEHAFIFEGDDGVSVRNIINRPNLSYFYGDGVQVDGGGSVTVNDGIINHCGRQAISNTRGQIIVNRGFFDHIGLYAIDGEPNDTSDLPFIQITVDGTDFRVIGDVNMPGHALLAQYSPGFTMVTDAIAGNRPGVDIRNTTADRNLMWFDYCQSVVVQGNSSDTPTTCQLTHAGSVTYGTNPNITRT